MSDTPETDALLEVDRHKWDNEITSPHRRMIEHARQMERERDEAKRDNQKFLMIRDSLEYIANAGISARHCENEARKALSLIDQNAPLSGYRPENDLIPACEDCGGELAEDLVCENIFCNPNSRPEDGRVCDCEDAPCCGHYER